MLSRIVPSPATMPGFWFYPTGDEYANGDAPGPRADFRDVVNPVVNFPSFRDTRPNRKRGRFVRQTHKWRPNTDHRLRATINRCHTAAERSEGHRAAVSAEIPSRGRSSLPSGLGCVTRTNWLYSPALAEFTNRKTRGRNGPRRNRAGGGRRSPGLICGGTASPAEKDATCAPSPPIKGHVRSGCCAADSGRRVRVTILTCSLRGGSPNAACEQAEAGQREGTFRSPRPAPSRLWRGAEGMYRLRIHS
jgi:hypothetical protein